MKRFVLYVNIYVSIYFFNIITSALFAMSDNIAVYVMHTFLLLGLPVMVIGATVIAWYYGLHVLKNKRLGVFKKLLWMFAPLLFFVPYLWYWNKYIKE